jgi:hypothetical protein
MPRGKRSNTERSCIGSTMPSLGGHLDPRMAGADRVDQRGAVS